MVLSLKLQHKSSKHIWYRVHSSLLEVNDLLAKYSSLPFDFTALLVPGDWSTYSVLATPWYIPVAMGTTPHIPLCPSALSDRGIALDLTSTCAQYACSVTSCSACIKTYQLHRTCFPVFVISSLQTREDVRVKNLCFKKIISDENLASFLWQERSFTETEVMYVAISCLSCYITMPRSP